MRIATFNINNARTRLDNLIDWLAEMERDVVCLQELKSADSAVPQARLEQLGY